MESHVYQRYALKDISPEFPFACRFQGDLTALKNSLSRHGQIAPVVILEETGKKPVLIAGHARFQAAKELGWKEMDARVVRENKKPADWFFFSVLTNWNQNWTDLDRCFVLDRAQKTGISEKEILEEMLPALGLASEKRYLDESKTIMSLCPEILQAVAQSRLPFRGAGELAVFAQADQRTFAARLAGPLALTSNQVMKSAEWLFDLAKARGEKLEVLLAFPDVERIISHERWNPRQKAELFYQWLRAQRFPEQVRREEAFVSAADRLAQEARQEKSEFSVEAPPFFEAEGITFRARLKDPESLERILEVIRKKRNLFNSLFDIVL